LRILVNPREPLERAAELARSAGARVVLGDEAASGSGILPGLEGRTIAPLLEATWPGRSPRAARAARGLEDACWIIFTSGTSGRSKAARFSHRRMIGAGLAWAERTGLGPADRCYIPLPLYHGNAMACAFSSCVAAGAAAVV